MAAATASPIEFSGLDPLVGQLGVAVGLLQAKSGSPGTYDLNPAWFENPIASTRDALTANGEGLADLLGALLGSLGGNALGVALQNTGDLNRWYPILNPSTGEPTGLYLVSTAVGPETTFGLGVNYSWPVSSGLSVRAWGLAPLLSVGSSTFELALGQQDHAITVGVETVSATPMVDAYGLQIGGMRISADLSLLPTPDASIAIEVVGLQLPGETKPTDRSLASLEELTGAQILSSAATIFVAALSEALGGTPDPRLAYLLPLLGLSSVLPADITAVLPDASLPLLRWDQIVASGADPTKPFKDWFNALLSDDTLLQTWLCVLQGIQGLTLKKCSGDGSRANPWTMDLLDVAQKGTLSVTVATTVATDGTRRFYPGLSFQSTKIQLGSSSAALMMAADLELAEFTLSSSSVSVDPTSLTFIGGVKLVGNGQTAGVDDPLFQGTVQGSTYTFGSLAAGLRIGDAGSSLSVIPSLTLNNIVTPNGSYASLDLTQPGDVVQKAEAELLSLIGTALNQLFGIVAGAEGSASYAIAALLGVVAPNTTGTSDAWPSKPPLSVAQLPTSLQHPIDALTGYYHDLVTSTAKVGGQPPFFYMLREVATLLQAANVALPAVTGTGTQTDPWLAPVTATGALHASVQAYVVAQTDGSQRIVLGLSLGASLNMTSGLEVDLSIQLDALGLTLNGASVTPQILPNVGLSLALPKPYTTPAVAGTTVTVNASGLQVGWSPYNGWSWSMHVGQPVLTMNGSHYPVGMDMVFSDISGLEALVTAQAASFGHILTGVLGLQVMRLDPSADKRAGLALAGLLGLLPDLGSSMPTGITWPSTMPVLSLTSFSDPLGVLRAQINGLFSSQANLKAALQLLSWASSGTGAVPALPGSGTFDDPFSVSFGLASGISLAVWSDASASTVGFGLDRSSTLSISTHIEATTRLTLRLGNFSLNAGSPVALAGVPGLRLATAIANPTGLLVPLTPEGVSIGSISAGLELSLSGGTVAVAPAFYLNSLTLPGQPVAARVDLAAPGAINAALAQQAFNTALAATLPTAVAIQPFGEVYDLLAVMGLANPQAAGAVLGINTQGWVALLADPLGFTGSRLLSLAEAPDTQAKLFALLQQVTGVTPPPVPAAVLQTMSALGLLNGADAGYAPIPSAFVAMFSQPLTFFRTRFAALLADQAALTQLLTGLQQTAVPNAFGPFTLQVLSGPSVQLAIAPGQVKAGSLLEFSGTATLAFTAGAQRLTIAASLANPQVAASLVPELSVGFDGTTSFTQTLVWGDSSLPAPAPLQIWPFDASAFVKSLSEVAPFYALSVLVSKAVDPLLLQPYPLVQALFSLLGIADKAADGTWQTKSLLGLFQDPEGWFLNDAVLGANGTLNIAQMEKLLALIPAASSAAGVAVSQVTNGIKVSGLPYDLAITLTADPAAKLMTLAPSLAAPLSVASGQATVNQLSFGLTLGPTFQPGLSGSIGVAIATPALSVTAGYSGGFTLAIAATGATPATLQLVPFPGWQTLVQNAGQLAVQELLPKLMSTLMEALNQSGAATFATAMQTFGTNMNVTALLSALVAAGADAEKLETAALAWLAQRLATANAGSTANAVVGLLQPLLSTSISAANGLISYTPSSTLPITLQLGVKNTNLLGLWAAVTLPAISVVEIGIQPTGIGVLFDPGTGVPTGGNPQISFGLSVGVPVKGEDHMPTLAIGYDNTQGGFSAGFDAMGTPATQSDLYVELLPTLTFGKPAVSVGDWLLQIIEQAIPRYLSLIVLNQATVKTWLDSALFGTTPAKVLVAAQLVTDTSGTYALASFASLAALTPEQFLGGLLKGLLGAQFTVLTFNGGKGKIIVGPSANGAGDCGVLIVAQDMQLGGNVTFQLGAADDAWLKSTGLSSGLGIFVPVDTVPHFGQLKLQLVNLGMDFHGVGSAPLVQLSRFSLGGVEPRAVLAWDFGGQTKAAPTVWGGVLTLSDIGLSLAPQSLSGGSSNPVAQNLLGSGSSDASSTGSNSTNPPFSVQAGYLYSKGTGTLDVELLQNGETATELWFQIQRSFGPLQVNMLGVEWIAATTHAGIGFDGSVQLAGLTVEVKQLTVSFNVKDPTDTSQYDLDLAGLDVSFTNPATTLSGSFYKEENPLRYDGTAVLKMGTFSITAIGSYAVMPVDPSQPNGPTAASMFVFVNLNMVLGGPPVFFIVGLAAGFGYNRDILIPAVGDIGDFPFVKAAVDPTYLAGGEKTDPLQALAKIASAVPPLMGAYWVAAGIKFTSFELINSFVLLFAKFGKSFEIDMVGVSTASLPPAVPFTLAYIELGILISFKPADGMISVQAQLTPNSYLLAPPCKLTGGFALVIWFSGDFVITLGGYHPAYNKPALYPDVPRLGFIWPMDIPVGSLSIAGGAYFALTPTAIMAGGFLQVAFSLGPIRAWLDAGADFLIQWKPFYYNIEIHISIGVEFHTSLLGVSITISASLGASLALWGPETAGLATIDWYVISFTIPIGNQQRNYNSNILGSWTDFANNFLPKPETASSATSGTSNAKLMAAADPAPAPPPGAVLKLTVPQGLMPTPGGQDATDPNAPWILFPSGWQLQIQTAVPATTITATNAPAFPAGVAMGVRPMNLPNADTSLVATLNAWDPKKSVWSPVDLTASNIAAASLTTNAPNALWSKSALSLDTPPAQDASLLANVYSGLTLTGLDATAVDPIGPIPLLSAFQFISAPDRFFPAWPNLPVPAAISQTNALARLSSTIMSPAVIATRNAVLRALVGQGIAVELDPQLTMIAAYAASLYQAPPVLSAPGWGATTSPVAVSAPALQAPQVAMAAAPVAASAKIQLIGGANRYASQVARPVLRFAVKSAEAVPALPSLRLKMNRSAGQWTGHTATRGPSAGLAALRAAPQANSAQEAVQVLPGTVALLSVSVPDTHTASATVQGQVPVRMLQLNQHDEVIGDAIISPGASVQLAPEAANVSLFGSADAGQQATGWQLNTVLAQVGRYSFAGDGFLVRAQATPQRRVAGRYTTHGLVEAARILQDNKVDRNGKSTPGWLETVFHGQPSVVAVSVRGINVTAAAEIMVHLAWSTNSWSPPYAEAATPVRVEAAQDGVILYFAPPANHQADSQTASWLGVLVAVPWGAALEGVFAFQTNLDAVVSDWGNLMLHAAGISPEGEPPQSTVQIGVAASQVGNAPAADVTAPQGGSAQ